MKIDEFRRLKVITMNRGDFCSIVVVGDVQEKLECIVVYWNVERVMDWRV